MVKVISFSLWGDKPMYTIGAIKNADLSKQFYPDFECWFYIHKDTVPDNIINELGKRDNVKIILKEGDLNNIKPMMWRFEAIDHPEVELMMSRDSDTRFRKREILAVNDWIKSDKLFHIMRDHPHHSYKILGGMFGTRKIENFNWIEKINNFNQNGDRMYDQDFLGDIIYPLIKENCMIHATFNKYESNCISFPINYDNEYKFVGEYVYEDESRSPTHIEILKNEFNKLPTFFDWQYYINNYEDLRNAGIDNEEKAYDHWVNNGKSEGRICYMYCNL